MALRGGRPKGAGLRHRQNPRDRNLAVRKHPGETILHKWAAMVQMGRCEGLPRRNLSGIKRIWQSDALKQRLAGVQSLVSHPRFRKSSSIGSQNAAIRSKNRQSVHDSFDLGIIVRADGTNDHRRLIDFPPAPGQTLAKKRPRRKPTP